jgi:hypothetical protein
MLYFKRKADFSVSEFFQKAGVNRLSDRILAATFSMSAGYFCEKLKEEGPVVKSFR